MPVGDAVQTRPTLEQEIAKFQGFTTENGEVAPGDETAEEATAREAREAADSTAALAVKGAEVVEETDEEKTTREAAEAETAKAAGTKTPKPKETAEQRIADITRTRRAAERELAAEKAARAADKADFDKRLAALERGEKSGLTPQRTAAKDGEAPDPKDFPYGELDPGYIRALARHETQQELASAAKKTKDEQQRDAASREAKEVAAQITAFNAKGAAKWDDFEEVVFEGAKNGEWPLSDALGKMLLTSEAGPAIAYHLASHPDEADEVFGKTPLEQAAWLGRQEAKLSSASPGAATGKTPVAKVTKAPIPPKEQARGAGGNSSVNEATPDFRQFERQWRGDMARN